jgi:ribose 5-phosphate isomerase B
MKIALGADHAGYALKEAVKRHLLDGGHDIEDAGTHEPTRMDYPVPAARVAEAVAKGQCDRGILVCGTGIGMAIAANRVRGVRAANGTSDYHVEMARRHNDANVLTLGGRVVAELLALRFVDIFLSTPFDGGRHATRVAMIDAAFPQGKQAEGEARSRDSAP